MRTHVSPGSVPFASRTVNSSGVKLAARDYGGQGAPLVLMHGAGMEQGSLQPLAGQLRSTFRVISFDFRGHGRSENTPWTLESAVRDVGAVAAAYRLEAPAVAGHSLGGMVAAAYARENSGCRAAINIDGHGRGRLDQYLGYDPAEVSALLDKQQARLDRLTRGPVAVLLRCLLTVLGKRPATSSRTLRQVIQNVDAVDLFAVYRAVRCPLLIFNAVRPEERRAIKLLAGDGVALTRAYRRGLSRDLCQLAANNQLVTVVEVDATHMLIKTHPKLVAERITGFWQQANDGSVAARG